MKDRNIKAIEFYDKSQCVRYFENYFTVISNISISKDDYDRIVKLILDEVSEIEYKRIKVNNDI